MPRLELVAPEEAPVKGTSLTESQEMYNHFVQETVASHKVGKLVPEDGERIQAIKLKLSYASRRMSTPIVVWDTGSAVYFKADDARKAESTPASINHRST